jgi:hypothetical protein
MLMMIERSEGAELGDEFDIDIDNSEDKPQRGGASARGARGRGGKTSVSHRSPAFICLLVIDPPCNILILRCQDQHETINTHSAVLPVVINKTQRKVQWIFQDGTVKQDPHLEVGAAEVGRPAEGEEGEAGLVIGDEGVRVLLLNVLGNLGESRITSTCDSHCICILYMIFRVSIHEGQVIVLAVPISLAGAR